MSFEIKIIETAKSGKVLSQCAATDLYYYLVQSAAILGVKEAITPEQVKLFQPILAAGYPHITANELPIACTMNITRALPRYVQCYSELNPDVLCAILSEYKQVRGLTLVKHRQVEESRTLPQQIEPKTISEEDWLNMISCDRENLKKGKDTWKLCSYRIVGWLFESGRLTDESFTTEQWKDIRRKARQIVMEGNREYTTRKIATMNDTERITFDNKCLAEVRTIIYHKHLTGKV